MLQEKNGVIEQLEKEKQRKWEQAQQAQADLARQAALLRDLQAHPKGKPHPKEPAVAPEQVCWPRHLYQLSSAQSALLERQSHLVQGS